MNHYSTFLKKGSMTLIADNEIVETKQFDKRTNQTKCFNYFKKKIEKSKKICEISIIYDNVEINKTLERMENYTDKRTLNKKSNYICSQVSSST